MHPGGTSSFGRIRDLNVSNHLGLSMRLGEVSAADYRTAVFLKREKGLCANQWSLVYKNYPQWELPRFVNWVEGNGRDQSFRARTEADYLNTHQVPRVESDGI